jgi:micrococcal nuclease
MSKRILYASGGIILAVVLIASSSSDDQDQERGQVGGRVSIATLPPPATTSIQESMPVSVINNFSTKTDAMPVSLPPTPQQTYFTVIKVIDGDTLSVDMDGTKETIRLLGINTPESVDPRKPVECFGKEASAMASELLSGKRIRIEKDLTQGDRDKYGRLLAYVYREDGLFFNKKMIEGGYAYEYTYNLPYRYQAEFKEAQRMAEEWKRGLWAPGVCETVQTSSPASSRPTDTGVPDPTSPAVTTPILPLVPSGGHICTHNAYNCKDFSTHAEAQAVFEECGGITNDIHGLDGGDNDGIACEGLP